MTLSVEKTALARQLGEDLELYLNTEIDPYDFARLSPRWDKKHSEEDVEDLSEKELKEFSHWLLHAGRNEVYREMEADPVEAPAYLYFEDAKMVPEGTWLVHFSSAQFSRFDRGSELHGLHLSTHKKQKDQANCRRLPETPWEAVWGFALLASRASWNQVREMTKHYGRNVMLFQSPGAVEAYHVGDSQRQVIFPICFETDAIPMAFDGERFWAEDDAGNDVEFENLDAAIEEVEREGSPLRPNGRARLTRVER